MFRAVHGLQDHARAHSTAVRSYPPGGQAWPATIGVLSGPPEGHRQASLRSLPLRAIPRPANASDSGVPSMDPSMGGGILLGSYESGLRRALAIRRWHITDSIVRELREI